MSSTDGLPSRAQLLQAAVLASFTGKAFEDVKFFAFSRRTRNGIVDQPKFLVANSSLVRKATSHFDPVLSGGFSESDLIDMDALYPSTLQQGVDDYGYTADSDLESEDEDLQGGPDSTRPLDPNQILAVLEHATASVRGTVKPRHRDTTTSKIPSITGTVSPDLQKIVGRVIEQLQHLSEAHTVKTCLPAGDVDGSTPVEGPDIARPDCNGGVTPTPDVATVISASLEEVSSGSQPKRRGRVIYLHDIAFKTWRAFLFYAYFDELSFAPLKSLKGSTVRISTNDPYGPPLCSPKSMYRLAEKYDIPALKQCARDDIRTQLSQSNILEEVFSSFTTLHPEIQELELDYLYDNIDSPSIQRELPEWIEAMEDGRLSKGTSRTLSSLFTKLVMGSADWRPRSQSNLGLPGGRQTVRTRPACYGPHRAPRVINIEPDGTHICNYCGGEVRAN